MKTFFRIIALTALLAHTTILFGQKIKNDSSSFSGTIKNIDNKGVAGDILPFYSLRNWFPADSASSPIRRLAIASDGNFSFKVPNLHQPVKISFRIRDAKTKILITRELYAEPGDQIKIECFENKTGYSIRYIGQGVEKYNLIERLNKQFSNEYLPKLRLLNLDSIQDVDLFISKMNELALILKEFKMKKAFELKSAKVSAQIREVIGYQFANYDDELRFRIYLFCQKYPTYQKQLWQCYLTYQDDFHVSPTKNALYAPNFLQCLLQKQLFELTIASGGNKVKIESFYKHIKTNYVGFVRDWLIGFSFVNHSLDNAFEQYDLSLKDSLLIEAESLVSLPYVKQALHRQRETIARTDDKKVIDAEFIGVNGDKFSLSSLKGKVYLIDTWFNGCAGCVQFYKRFEKEVHPKFKNNKNFAVLSISMDKNKERWASGIESNLYTSKEHVNIWTGNFTDHPFLKYYQLQGGARQMLVSADGTIIYKGTVVPSDILVKEITTALSSLNDSSNK